MNTVVKMQLDTDEYRLNKFAEFNKFYPHNPGRRNKAKARALFLKLTAGPAVTRS